VTDASGAQHRAGTVVLAAGAWVDEVAGLFGSPGIGIRPLRRTLFTVPAPEGLLPTAVPFTDDIGGTFYFRTEGNGLLCSPQDAELEVPRDTRPDPLDIARAIEAINEATTLGIRRVRSTWAGQRSFSPDDAPVVGRDPHVDGLVWFAGQGGYGIQLAPALARAGAALVTGDPLPPDLPVDVVAALSPARFRC
jgi:D-arginine dehydrogenase